MVEQMKFLCVLACAAGLYGASAVEIVDNAALNVPAGETATLAAGASATIPVFNVNGDLTLGAGSTLNVAGRTDVISMVASNSVGSVTIGANAKLSVTSVSLGQNSTSLAIGVMGGTGTVTVASGGRLEVKGRIALVRNADNAEARALPSRADLVIAGTVETPAHLELAAFYPNTGLDHPENFPLATVLTLQEGALLKVGFIQANDAARDEIRIEGNATIQQNAANAWFQTGGARVDYIISEGKTLTFDTQSYNAIFDPVSVGNYMTLSGAGGLVKKGAGRLEIRPRSEADISFTGPITVEAGTLTLGSPLADGQTVYVKKGAKFMPSANSDLPKITYEDPASEPAWMDTSLYTVMGNLSGGLDLVNMPYDHDALGGPVRPTAKVTLSGTVTHEGGTTFRPFRLIGQEATAMLELLDTGLESTNTALQLEGPGTFAFPGARTFNQPDDGHLVFNGIRDVASVSTNPVCYFEGTNVFLTPASSPYVVAGGGLRGWCAYVGQDGVEGHVVVKDGGLLKSDSEIYVSSNLSGDNRSNYASSITVTNGVVDGACLRFHAYGLTDGVSSRTEEPLGVVTLQAGGILKGNVYRNDDPTARLVFDGGSIEPLKPAVGYPAVFCSAQEGQLQIEARPGQFIDMNMNAGVTNALAWGMKSGAVRFMGDGGFRLRGTGTLEPGATIATANLEYKGDTVIDGGTFSLSTDNLFPYGEGKGILRKLDGHLALNGHVLTLNDFEFRGGKKLPGGTLRLGADGRDFTLKVPFSPDVNATIDKIGAGTMTLAQNPPTTLMVSGGTLRLGPPRPGHAYRFFRFKVLRAHGRSANSMQIGEFKLLDNGVDVTRPYARVGRSTRGTASPAAESPEKAVDGKLDTKFLDFNAAYNSAYPDDCFLELEYERPIAVTHYTWATANDCAQTSDALCRHPKIFQLLASDDGQTWDQLDERAEYAAPTSTNTWINDEFLLGGANLATNTTTLVRPGATLAVTSPDARVKAFDVTSAGTIDIVPGAMLTVENGGVGANALTGGGTLALAPTEGSTSSFLPPPGFTGTVKVARGTLNVVNAADVDAKYFMLVIRKTGKADSCMQISEFGLYDANVQRQNSNLTMNSSARTASELAPGTCCPAGSYAVGSEAENIDKLFDGKCKNGDHTKWCVTKTNLSTDDPSAWRIVYMRLADDANPVTGYNLCTANDSPLRSPISWSLLASYDGASWFLLDAKDNVTAPSTTYAWYAENPYPFAGGASGGAYEVAAGATALFSSGAAATGLTVDCSAEGGTLVNFAPAKDGVLNLVNAPASLAGYQLPLAFTGTSANLSNAGSWKVMVDGAPSVYRLTIANGRATLIGVGAVIYIR